MTSYAEALLPSTKDIVIAIVNDKTMTIYAKATAVSAIAQKQLLHHKVHVTNAKKQLLDKVPVAKARVLQAPELLLSKAKQSKCGVILLALNARVYNGVLYIQAEVFKVGNMMKDKLNVAYTCILASVENIPRPLTCRKLTYSLLEHTEAAGFWLKDGMLSLQEKSAENLQSSKAKAMETLAGAKPKLEAYLSKVNGTAARSKALQEYTIRVYSALREALDGLPLDSAFIASATNKVQILKSKLGDLPVYVKDGVVHATGQVEAGYVHVKASIKEVKGSLNLSLVEAVSSAKTQCQDAAQATMIKADEMKNTSKAAMEAGKHKVLIAVDYSKEMASDRKVQAIAAGAVVGASAGGATGFAAGATAGTACGLLFVPFTLGLSLPIGAVIGGSTGTGFGAIAGTTFGAIGGKYASENYMDIKKGSPQKSPVPFRCEAF